VEFPGFCRHALGALRNGDASAIAAWGCSWADNENCSQHLDALNAKAYLE